MYVAVSPTPAPVVLTAPFSGLDKAGHWTARINYVFSGIYTNDHLPSQVGADPDHSPFD